MPISLGSGDDQDPNAFTAAIARRLGLNQTNQGYQYSSASPAVQNSEPAYQSTPSAGQPAPQQQDAPPNSRDLGMGAQQAAARLAPTPYSGPQLFGTGGQVVAGRPGGLSGAFSPNESNGGALSPGIQAVTGQQNYRDLSPQQQNQMQQAGLALQAPLLGRDIANLGLNAPGILRGIGDLGGDFASAIGRRLGLGASGAADAERLAALRGAGTVGQDAMRYGQPGRQGLGLADRIPGAAPYASAPVGDIAQPLSDVAARNAALAAVRGASRFPSEIPAGEVAAENLGGIGGALQRAVTNPNVYLGGGTVAGIGGATLLAAQQGGNIGATNAATGSTSPIIDANTAANNQNNLATDAGRTGSLAGPAQGGGTVGSQPTPTTPTIQQPTGSGGSNPQPSFGSVPTGGGQAGTGGIGGNQPQSAARGGVNPLVSQPLGGQGSQGGTGTVPTSGGLPSQGGPTSPSAQPSDLAALTQQAAQSLTGISSELANTKSPDVLNVFLQQGQSILDMLKSQEDQLRSDAQKNGTTIDPATQFTLDTMQKQLDGQLQGVRENLNRRGLLQSGIELASENQVRSGSLSAQGQLLATRLSKIQQDLENGLKSVNSQRIQTAQQFGLGGARAQASADNSTLARRDDLLKALANASLTFRGQANTANEGNLNRQNQFAIADANRQAADARLNQSQQFTAQQNDLGRQASDARQMAALLAAAGNADAARQYSAQAAELQRQFQASQQQNQQTFTGQQNDLNRANQQPSTNSTKLATDNFIAQLEGASNKQSAMDAYNQALQDGTFQNAGADPLAILNAINSKQWGGGFQLPFGLGQ